MSNLNLEIDELLKYEINQRHSYFQLKFFVIGKEPTTQAKMWQCLKELKARKESLDAVSLEIDETKDKIDLLNIKLKKMVKEKYEDELDNQELQIKIRQIKRQIESQEKNLLNICERQRGVLEEARFFVETFRTYEKIEPLKHADDYEEQKKYWGERLANKLNLKMLTNTPLEIDLIETIISLPDDMEIKSQVLNTLKQKQAMVLKQIQNMNQIKQEN